MYFVSGLYNYSMEDNHLSWTRNMITNNLYYCLLGIFPILTYSNMSGMCSDASYDVARHPIGIVQVEMFSAPQERTATCRKQGGIFCKISKVCSIMMSYAHNHKVSMLHLPFVHDPFRLCKFATVCCYWLCLSYGGGNGPYDWTPRWPMMLIIARIAPRTTTS